ncbi:AraC family transcriptional regulator [Marinobacter alexandrii]|uniref:AraC family transcriptional regulator n=1 Tax=Marinobacter alexandrii TaxID=2570351 RepID=UPI00329A4753
MQEQSASPVPVNSMSYGEVAERNLTLGWNLDYRPLSAAEYQGYIACREMENSSAAFEQVAFKAECAGEYLGDEIVLLFVSNPSSEGAYTQGIDIADNSVLLMNTACELEAKMADNSRVGQLYISPEAFSRAWESLAPGTAPFQFDNHGFIKVDEESVQHLLRKTAALVHAEDVSKLEQDEFLSGVLALLADKAMSGQTESFSSLRPYVRMRALARARDYIKAHLGEPISLSEVCSEAGVSISTLLRIFREFYDVSPQQYIQVMRLQECRSLLQQADPDSGSVSSIMQACGLGSHGRSSRAYSRFSGERPKQTLGYRSRKS